MELFLILFGWIIAMGVMCYVAFVLIAAFFVAAISIILSFIYVFLPVILVVGCIWLICTAIFH